MQPNQSNNSKKMYPISVEYVFKLDYDPEDKTVMLIRDYCRMMDIKFTVRNYDSINVLEDKTLIKKLPAVHVFIKNVHAAITYPDENPLYAIRTVYSKFDIEYMSYLSKQQIWSERLNSIKRMFLGHSSKTDLTLTKHI